jgi:phage/plasmid-like protein (TIGR03299 family)
MAHGLTQHNDMAYNALNKAPWHGLGVALPGLMTAKEVAEACPRFADPVLKVPAELDGSPVPGHFFTIRADDRTVLGHVGAEYQVAQNLDLLKVAEAYCQDAHGPLFETAGILWNGRKSWVLAKFPQDMILKGRNGSEDVIGQYLLFSNAHDGSQRLRVQATPIRVVCQNTLNMATHSNKRNTSAWVCHSGDIVAKLENVKDVLGIAAREFAETKELYQALIRVEPSKEQVETVLKALIPDTVSKRAELQRERVLQLAEAGTGNAPYAGTAWGLYNGFTELSDHVNNSGSKREDAQDMRVNSAWFGSGAAWKGQALKTIAEVCLN